MNLSAEGNLVWLRFILNAVRQRIVPILNWLARIRKGWKVDTQMK